MTNESTIWRAHAEAGATPPENYERYFVPAIARPFAIDLVEEAGLRPGERVLDVACGTGVIARLAAERVGGGDAVAGLDVNPGMLAVARRTAAAAGAGIQWYETMAESIPLPDGAFDVAFCHLSLQFVADRGAALREIRRVLAPGGRALVSLPHPTPFFDVLDEALVRHAGEQAAGFVRVVFSLDDPDEVERLFREAGFDDVAVRVEKKTLRLPAAADFLWQYVHSTPLTGLLTPLDAERKNALERDVVEGWSDWSDDGGMVFDQAIIVATAASNRGPSMSTAAVVTTASGS